MNTKSIFKIIYFIIYVSASIIFATSCNDVIVDIPPTAPPDTVDLYSWRKVPFGYFNDLYAADTSNIYICASHQAVRWDGSSNPPQVINFNDNNFRPELVKGFDVRSVFIGGSYGMTNACVKRVTNDVVTETYYFDSVGGYVNHLLSVSSDEIWISFPNNMIAHYKNDQITKLYLEKLNSNPKIFKFKDGNLYIFAEKPGNGSNIPPFLNCYKIENEQFTFIRSDSISQGGPGGIAFRLYQIGNEIVMYDDYGMFRKFSGNDWINYSGFPGFLVWGLGGNAIDSMIAFTFTNGAHYIHTWNGNRWRKEIKSNSVIGYDLNVDLFFEPISVVGNNVYVMLGDIQQSYLLIGRRKELF